MTLRFIAIGDRDYLIRSMFPEAAEFKTVEINHGIVLENFEDVFVVLIMSDQAGQWHWSVTHSQIDGPQSTESGTQTCQGYTNLEQVKRIEDAINGAFKHFTHRWISKYLPTNQGDTE